MLFSLKTETVVVVESAAQADRLESVRARRADEIFILD